MVDHPNPFDDDLGPDPIDRGSSKSMGPGGGGGNFIDPSYEEALRILGREHKLPSQSEQRALIMDDPESAELASLITALRNATGARPPFDHLATLGDVPDERAEVSTVESLIHALQEFPPDTDKLTTLKTQLDQVSHEIRELLERIWHFPEVAAKLNFEES